MRGAFFDGTNVQMRDVELQAPKAGEVLVDVTAAGVCHSDLHVMRGEWELTPPKRGGA